MKQTLIATLIASVAVAAMVVGCTTQAQAITVIETPSFRYVHDWSEPKNPEGAVRIMQEMEAKKAAQAEQEAAEAAIEAEAEYEGGYAEYGAYSGSPSVSYSGDGFKQQGVRYHDGRTETWYSSNSAYHYRTAEWTVDDEGYYRDSDGYYVVASDDHAQGEVVNTSKGEAKVYDDGTYSGNIDFYVGWN